MMSVKRLRMIRALRAGVAPAAKTMLLRLGGYAAFRRLVPSRGVAILRYHAVCGAEGAAYCDPGIIVSPAAFENHVRYLAANYAVLPLLEVVARLRAARPLPPNAVAITFDDGYVDNLAAARTLNRYGLTATFFITAGCVGGGEPFWLAELRTVLSAIREPSVQLSVGGAPLTVELGSLEKWRKAVRSLTTVIKAHPIGVRESMRDQLRRAAGNPATPRCILNWDELREMQRLGMTIGAHTLTHPNLPKALVEDANREIRESRRCLEQELGAAVTLFAYPNGGAEQYMTPAIARMVRDNGYEAAATSRNAFAGSGSDLYALERIQVREPLEELVFALELERLILKPRPRPGEAAAR
jgi:peptidoglycan/xylan/chitin deacetylase (PgdA/CDA1 family)